MIYFGFTSCGYNPSPLTGLSTKRVCVFVCVSVCESVPRYTKRKKKANAKKQNAKRVCLHQRSKYMYIYTYIVLAMIIQEEKDTCKD